MAYIANENLVGLYLQAVPAIAATMSSTASDAEPSKTAQYAAALGGILAGVFGASCVASANEVSDGLHSPHYPWPHDGVLDSYDHASIRRGHKVKLWEYATALSAGAFGTMLNPRRLVLHLQEAGAQIICMILSRRISLWERSSDCHVAGSGLGTSRRVGVWFSTR
jgi:hypothetical protein